MAANETVTKSRILTGPGVLYKAPLGTLVPGQVQKTDVSNKALTSNVVTLTTTADHGFVTDDEIIVDIGDTIFDGLWTVIDAPTTTTLTYAVTHADVTSGAATGSITQAPWQAGGTVSGSVFTDAWPSGWVPIGVTKSGSEFSHAPSTGNVEVAEYLLPLQIVTTGVEEKIKFEIAEYTLQNFAFGLNGGTVATVSGSGATLLSSLRPPVVGQETRHMIGWGSDDLTERFVGYQAFQTGTLSVKHAKGTDNATIATEFGLEQPSIGDAFNIWTAGATPVGS